MIYSSYSDSGAKCLPRLTGYGKPNHSDAEIVLTLLTQACFHFYYTHVGRVESLKAATSNKYLCNRSTSNNNVETEYYYRDLLLELVLEI